VHLGPRLQLIELDVLEVLVFVIENRQDGLFSPFPFDLDARVIGDLRWPQHFVALEEDPQLLVLV